MKVKPIEDLRALEEELDRISMIAAAVRDKAQEVVDELSNLSLRVLKARTAKSRRCLSGEEGGAP